MVCSVMKYAILNLIKDRFNFFRKWNFSTLWHSHWWSVQETPCANHKWNTCWCREQGYILEKLRTLHEWDWESEIKNKMTAFSIVNLFTNVPVCLWSGRSWRAIRSHCGYNNWTSKSLLKNGILSRQWQVLSTNKQDVGMISVVLSNKHLWNKLVFDSPFLSLPIVFNFFIVFFFAITSFLIDGRYT
jgi:hypothetical protein